MGSTYGPFNSSSIPQLVAGTAFQIAVPPDTAFIQLHNDTPYRVYVQFDGVRPVSSQAQGAYGGVAGPWSHPVIAVSRGIQGQFGLGREGFLGGVWILPISVSGSLATTGTESSLAEIHIDSFMPGEAPPQSWAMPRQQDLTSQPRVITIPAPAGACHNYHTNFTAAAQVVFPDQLLNTAIAPVASWAHNLAFYMHAAGFVASCGPSTNFLLNMQLELVQLDNSSAVIHMDTVLQFFLASQITGATNVFGISSPYIWTPASPYAFGFIPLANTVAIALALECTVFNKNGTSATISIMTNVQADIDWMSNGSVPPIGQGAGATTGGKF